MRLYLFFTQERFPFFSPTIYLFKKRTYIHQTSHILPIVPPINFLAEVNFLISNEVVLSNFPKFHSKIRMLPTVPLIRVHTKSLNFPNIFFSYRYVSLYIYLCTHSVGWRDFTLLLTIALKQSFNKFKKFLFYRSI